MKILVVDDDPVTRLLLQASLAGTGHRVQEAADGLTAWSMLQREPFRLVITDWMMPGLDGIELVRRIRTAEFSSYVYVVLLTVKGGKEEIISGLEAGADDYLTKPFNPNELRARVAIGERIINLETSLSETRDQLADLAARDGLTGLSNRRTIYEQADAELQRSLRSAKPMSLILLDLDDLRMINDLHGLHIGDQALCLVANTLKQNRRIYDYIGRWSHDEFLLVLPETNAEDAWSAAERLAQAIYQTQLHPPEGEAIQLRTTVGVTALQPEEPVPLPTLLRQASTALNRSRQKGSGTITLFSRDIAEP